MVEVKSLKEKLAANQTAQPASAVSRMCFLSRTSLERWTQVLSGAMSEYDSLHDTAVLTWKYYTHLEIVCSRPVLVGVDVSQCKLNPFAFTVPLEGCFRRCGLFSSIQLQVYLPIPDRLSCSHPDVFYLYMTGKPWPRGLLHTHHVFCTIAFRQKHHVTLKHYTAVFVPGSSSHAHNTLTYPTHARTQHKTKQHNTTQHNPSAHPCGTRIR